MTFEEVNKWLSKLRIPLSMVVTPVNLEEERKRFRELDNYNPQFEYKIVKNDNEEILEELSKVEEIPDIDPNISEFYIQLIEDKKLTNNLMNAVGDNDLFTDLAMQKFKMPTDVLFRNACRVMRGNYKSYNVVDTSMVKREEFLGYNEIKDIFQNTFDAFGLKDWGVNKSKNIRKNGIKTGIKSKEVFIDPVIKKTPLEVKKTVVHELTHIIRAYNGSNSGVGALARPNLNSYLDVEEGLAMWNEESMDLLKDKDLKEKATIVYAISLGREMSFCKLYEVLFGMYSPKKAFYLTYLVKRGLGDTSKPGIFPKSASYFRGFRKVKRKLNADASLYNKLYAGKIGFKQVKWVDEGLIQEPTIVPSKELFKEVFKNFQ